MKLDDPHIINAISYFLENDIPVSNKLLEYVDLLNKSNSSTKYKCVSLIEDLDLGIKRMEAHTHINAIHVLNNLKSYKKDFQEFLKFLENTKKVELP